MLIGSGSPHLSGTYWSVDDDARLFLFGEGAPDDLSDVLAEIFEDYRFLTQQLDRMGQRTPIASVRITPTVARSLWKGSGLVIQQLMFAYEAEQCIHLGGFKIQHVEVPLQIVRATEYPHFDFEVRNFYGEKRAQLRGKLEPHILSTPP